MSFYQHASVTIWERKEQAGISTSHRLLTLTKDVGKEENTVQRLPTADFAQEKGSRQGVFLALLTP